MLQKLGFRSKMRGTKQRDMKRKRKRKRNGWTWKFWNWYQSSEVIIGNVDDGIFNGWFWECADCYQQKLMISEAIVINSPGLSL